MTSKKTKPLAVSDRITMAQIRERVAMHRREGWTVLAVRLHPANFEALDREPFDVPIETAPYVARGEIFPAMHDANAWEMIGEEKAWDAL